MQTWHDANRKPEKNWALDLAIHGLFPQDLTKARLRASTEEDEEAEQGDEKSA
jgi:hypothetical protein